MTKQTVGAIASDLSTKQSHDTHTVTEQMQEQLAEYDKNIDICIAQGIKTYSDDFYVVVLTKKERLMHNVIRNYFFCRSTCPTPEWDQTTYKYHFKDQMIEFLWVIPAKDACAFIRENALSIPPEQHLLRDFVLSFYDGSLLRKSKQLNGEVLTSPLLQEI